MELVKSQEGSPSVPFRLATMKNFQSETSFHHKRIYEVGQCSVGLNQAMRRRSLALEVVGLVSGCTQVGCWLEFSRSTRAP